MGHLIIYNSQSVKNDLTYCRAGVKEHKIVSKLKELTSNWNDIPQDERHAALHSTHHQLQRIMTNADKKCVKPRIGSIEYSLEPLEIGLR